MPVVVMVAVVAMVAMGHLADMVCQVWMPLDTQVDLMVVQEALVEMEETQPMALMVVMVDSFKSLYQKPIWIFSKCLVRLS